MVIGSDREATIGAAETLEAAGHRPHLCSVGPDPFPCDGLADPGRCPLNRHMDVALLAQSGTAEPLGSVPGVTCALRARVPLVEQGPTGPGDPYAPWLAAPAGIAFLQELGFDAVRAHNHRLAWDAARALVERWDTSLGVNEACVGSMVALPLPERAGSTREDAVRLRDALLFEEGIEVQMHARQGRLYTRLSAQVYNERDDFERLGEAVARRQKHRPSTSAAADVCRLLSVP